MQENNIGSIYKFDSPKRFYIHYWHDKSEGGFTHAVSYGIMWRTGTICTEGAYKWLTGINTYNNIEEALETFRKFYNDVELVWIDK